MEGKKPPSKTFKKVVKKPFATSSKPSQRISRAEMLPQNRYLFQATRRARALPLLKPVSSPSVQSPFYLQITNTPETKINGGLPLLTLPAGTVLFRGVRIPNVAKQQDARYFYRDFLGEPLPNNTVCMPPTHNAFMYPFPFVAFGAYQVGETFHTMQAVVLVHPVTVICSVAPSKWVRGDAQRLTSTTDPYARCTVFPDRCRDLTEEQMKRRAYNNCLNPLYAARSGVRGWMAVAAMDSVKSKKLAKQDEDSPMLEYLKDLEKRFPGRGTEAMAWLYTDNNRNIGFPEIALYPYRVHPGDIPIQRPMRNDQMALRLIEQEAENDNLNYLPLATFTKSGIVNMVKGFYDYRRMPINSDTFSIPTREQQASVEGFLNTWMNDAMTKGMYLPGYGSGKLSFDSRTGFYVFPQLVPKNLMVPVPDADIAAAEAKLKGGVVPMNLPKQIPYSFLLMPLDTPENRQLVLLYMLIFRTYNPGSLNTKFGLEKGKGVRRAMILNRPPVLNNLFVEMDVKMPESWKAPLARASLQYKKDQATKSKEEVAAVEAAAAKVASEGTVAVINSSVSAYNVADPTLSLRTIKPSEFVVVKEDGMIVLRSPLASVASLPKEQLSKAIDDAGLLPFAQQDEKESPVYVFNSVQTYNSANSEVRGKMDYYFSNVPKEERYRMQADRVGLYSCTAPSIADSQTKIILEIYKELSTNINSKEAPRIVDATACIGGNTISFARAGVPVTAFEVSPQRARFLANNALLTGQEANIQIVNGDFTKLYKFVDFDILYMDPPWGGPEYKNKSQVEMMLGEKDVKDLLMNILFETPVKLIALKAPLNYNVKGLQELFVANQVPVDMKVIEQEKMMLILLTRISVEANNNFSNIVGTKGGSRYTRKNILKRSRTKKQSKQRKSTSYITDFSKVWYIHGEIKKI